MMILIYTSWHVKICFICVKSVDTVRCPVVLLKRRPGAVRCPTGHQPMLSYIQTSVGACTICDQNVEILSVPVRFLNVPVICKLWPTGVRRGHFCTLEEILVEEWVKLCIKLKVLGFVVSEKIFYNWGFKHILWTCVLQPTGTVWTYLVGNKTKINPVLCGYIPDRPFRWEMRKLNVDNGRRTVSHQSLP